MHRTVFGFVGEEKWYVTSQMSVSIANNMHVFHISIIMVRTKSNKEETSSRFLLLNKKNPFPFVKFCSNHYLSQSHLFGIIVLKLNIIII